MRTHTGDVSAPFPSVVFGLTARNGEAHLAEALESLITQSRRDLAVIVVDDCSTDGTRELALAYAALDPRVVYERNDRVLGLVRNWRRAFDLARERFPGTPYFAWASDHDVWHPSWLESLVGELDAHPDAVLAYPLTVRIDDAGAEYPTRERSFETVGMTDPIGRLRWTSREMAAGEMIYGLFRRDALARCGPYPLVVLPDRLLLLRLAVEGEFRQVPRRLWFRRYRSGVVMSNRRQRGASFPDGVPLRAYVPWWLAHALLFTQSVRSAALGRVVLVDSVLQAYRRRREREQRRRRWRRRERRRRLGTLLRGALGSRARQPRPERSADTGRPHELEAPGVDFAILERAELLAGLDRPGAVVLELGAGSSGLAVLLKSRFPELVHVVASEPGQFPERVDLAVSSGWLEHLAAPAAERCIRRLHELGTPTLYTLGRERPSLLDTLGRWYWLRELYVEEGRRGRKPNPARGLVDREAGRSRHLVGRRRLRPVTEIGPPLTRPAVERSKEAEAGRLSKQERRVQKLARAELLEQARELMPYVSVAVGNDVFFVPTSDFRIGATLFIRSRSKDMEVLARALGHLVEVGHRLPAEPVFLDVGANLGTAATTALRHHRFSSAVALEPSPGNFKALRLGLVANGLETRVQALQVAASDREGERVFDVSQPNSGAHRLLAEGAERPEQTAVVEVVTIDELVSRGVIDSGRVGLVWVDTAGHEAHALAGGARLLEAGIPIVTAVKHGWPETEAALVELLTPYYTEVVDLREPASLRPIGEFRRLIDGLERSTDVLLVRR